MRRRRQQWQRNKINYLLLGIAAIAVFSSKDNVASNLQQMGELREKMQAQTSEQMDILASEDDKAEREKIAIARFQRGCVLVVATKDLSKLVSLQEGEPVLDNVTKRPIAAGTTVCDEAGNTGEIVKVNDKPVVGKMAFTGNREVVETAIERLKAAHLRRSKSNQRG